MRGFPLINGALILLALGLALVPLWKLTSAPEVVAVPAVQTEDRVTIPTAISVQYAHAPDRLVISHLGQELWSAGSATEIDEGAEVALALPKEGIDLHVAATWPAGTPKTAIEIALEPEALAKQSANLWSEDGADDILTFQWDE